MSQDTNPLPHERMVQDYAAHKIQGKI